MNLNQAIQLGTRLIHTGDKHQDYERVTKLAEDYKIFITGKDICKKLERMETRETKEAFNQRVKLTKSITPAVASSLRQPFNKVTRNDRVRTNISISAADRLKNTNDMISTFYGSKRKKNRGLNYFMKTRFADIQFSDPNAWIIVEWDAVEKNQVIQPRPFEVSAKQAINFFVTNDEVRWLMVEESIKYPTYKDPRVNAPGVPGNLQLPANLQPPITIKETAPGCRFTLYDEEFTVVFEQVDNQFETDGSYSLFVNDEAPEMGERYVTIKEKKYLVKIAQPKLGYAAAFRIGYKRDEETDSRTFVNPWHDSLCFFEKSLKTVSELDLTMTLHVFPQKYQYVPKCTGPSANKAKKCMSGLLPDGSTCPACKGTGYKPIHTSAQDVILIPMPDNPEDMIDLSKLSVTQSPPIDLVKWQNEYCLQLETQCHQAVFNSQVFVKKSTNKQGIGGNKTATEIDVNMQSIYDALEPFTEKFSELWIDFVTTFGLLSGEKLDKISVSHDFPADYKLKTSDVLLAEREIASVSGAPSFLIDVIDDDLATITYAGDGLGLQKFRVKKRFLPFAGSTADEITYLLGSQYVPQEPKILYSNFDQIFKELDFKNVGFFLMTDLKKQRGLVDEKVLEFMEKLKAQTPSITIDSLSESNPANQNNNDNENDQEETDTDNNSSPTED